MYCEIQRTAAGQSASKASRWRAEFALLRTNSSKYGTRYIRYQTNTITAPQNESANRVLHTLKSIGIFSPSANNVGIFSSSAINHNLGIFSSAANYQSQLRYSQPHRLCKGILSPIGSAKVFEAPLAMLCIRTIHGKCRTTQKWQNDSCKWNTWLWYNSCLQHLFACM